MVKRSILALLFSLIFLFSLNAQVSVQAQKPIRLPRLAPTTQQGMEGGFWLVEKNFNPVLRLKNVLLNQPLTVTPTLYFADGTEYLLPAVVLEKAGVAQINIRNALQTVPDSIKSHVSDFGMVGISYQWSWPAVIASIQNTDEVASLTITNSLRAESSRVHKSPEADSAQVCKGSWWLPTAKSDGYLILENTSLSAKQVHVQFTGHAGNTLVSKQVSLPSHSTSRIKFSETFGGVRGNERSGGILVQYPGPDYGVLTYAGIEDSTVGFSVSPLVIEDHLDHSSPVHQVTLSAPGLLLGKADPEMAFPNGTYFQPYAVLHNFSAHTLAVNMSLVSPLLIAGGEPHESGTPQTLSLGQISLQPGETTQFDFDSHFGAVNPLPDGYGHLTASFQGQDGDLLLETGSVDQTKNFVFEVATSQQAESASRTICFWSVENTNDSMITVWNYTNAAQDMELTLYYSGGQYTIPIHLEALESYNLDMLMLIRSRSADPYGNVIPSGITSGSAFLSSPGDELEKLSVAVSSAVYSVHNATCGVICVTCNGATWLAFEVDKAELPVQQSVQEYVQLAMNTGTIISNPSGGIWETSKPAIASVNSKGLHTGVSVGQTTSYFILTQVPVNAGTICASEIVSCPSEGLEADVPVDVGPVVMGISQQNFIVGQSGEFQIFGQGFFGMSPEVTVSGSGINIAGASSVGDGTINVTYTVDCGATLGPNYTLTVGFNGSILFNDVDQPSGQLAYPLDVELPLPVAPTIQFNGTALSGTQAVDVGQQIALTGVPPTMPNSCFSAVHQWTPPTGTAVGGYTTSLGSGSVTPISQVSATNAAYTFYWIVPGSSLTTTYQYQMTSQAGTTEWSQPATATFNVAGPTVSSMSTPTGTVDIYPGPVLGYGGPYGIQFIPTRSAPSGDSGQFEWVQLITNDTITRINTAGTTQTCVNPTSPPTPNGTGLDTDYPYSTKVSEHDAPTISLDPSKYTSEARSFSAKMYFLWDPVLPSGCIPGTSCTSIPTPLGSVSWGWSGTAIYSAGNWSLASPQTISPVWTPGSSYPTWSALVPYTPGSQLSCH